MAFSEQRRTGEAGLTDLTRKALGAAFWSGAATGGTGQILHWGRALDDWGYVLVQHDRIKEEVASGPLGVQKSFSKPPSHLPWLGKAIQGSFYSFS